jgi:hypothetical protein
MKIITSILKVQNENPEEELVIASDLKQKTPENADDIISGAILEIIPNEIENNE